MRVLAVQDRELDQITPALTANGFQVAAVVGPNDDLSLHAQRCSTEGVVLDLRSPDTPLLARLADLSQRRPSRRTQGRRLRQRHPHGRTRHVGIRRLQRLTETRHGPEPTRRRRRTLHHRGRRISGMLTALRCSAFCRPIAQDAYRQTPDQIGFPRRSRKP